METPDPPPGAAPVASKQLATWHPKIASQKFKGDEKNHDSMAHPLDLPEIAPLGFPEIRPPPRFGAEKKRRWPVTTWMF